MFREDDYFENDPGMYEITYWDTDEMLCHKSLFALNETDALQNFTLPYRGIIVGVEKLHKPVLKP